MNRTLKQIIIALVFALIIGGGIYFFLKLMNPPSCNDGVKNQNEEGIDCGGVCAKKCAKPIQYREVEVGEPHLIEDEGVYDVAVEIKNPNPEYGFKEIEYEVLIYADKNVIGRRSGETYLLPGESRFVVETGIEVNSGFKPNQVELSIKGLKPQEFVGKEKPKIEIVNENYRYVREPGSFFEVTFQVVNKSGLTLDTIDLETVVYTATGEIIAVNKATINTVEAGETRDFRFFWPRTFSGVVSGVYTRAGSNTLLLYEE